MTDAEARLAEVIIKSGGTLGDCYMNAARMVVGPLGFDSDLKLVHGRPILSVPPFIEYGHAWVEQAITDEFVLCIDGNTGDVIPKHLYYRVGGIQEEDCYSYTPNEARAKMRKFKHYGPWDGPHGVPPIIESEAITDEE